MNSIKTVAVDDEAPALRRLVKMIENHSNLTLIGTARNSIEAREIILKHNPDLLLLDIQLKDATVFDLLLEIQNSFSGKIIFCTAYDHFALKAFDFQAIDYLLKPYSEDRFKKSIDRMIQQKEKSDLVQLMKILSEKQKDSKTIKIPEGNKNYFLSADMLYYVSADGYYSNFILKNEKKLIRISLKNLEEILPEKFIRINKSTIINKEFISEMILNKSSSKIIMPDRNEFDISEKWLKEFQLKIQ